MTALTASKGVRRRDGEFFSRGVAANAKIFAGAIVCLSAGFAVKGTSALNLIADGVAEESVDNTGGAAGAIAVQTRPGNHYCVNSLAADLITVAEIGTDCFIVDDQTVAKTSGGGTRSRAGKILDVDAANGVLVAIGILKG